jgi:ABC-type methionine transport system permease subunit
VRTDLAILLAAFVAASALAGLFGAPNLGTALAFGQMAFALTVTGLMLLRRR